MAKAKAAADQAPVTETVLVELTSSMAGHNFSYAAGQLLNVAPAVAERWISHGIARPGEQRVHEVQDYVEPEHVEVEDETKVVDVVAAPADDSGELADS